MQPSNIITKKVVIVLSAYNSRTYVNKGLSKAARAKNIVAQRKKDLGKNENRTKIQETSKEKLLNLYRGKEIDISDPNGYYLINSGWNIKTPGGLGRIESEAFSRLMSDLFQNKTFEQLAQATTTPSEIMERAIDLNESINVSVAQKTKTFSSIEDLRTSYDYMKYVEAHQGKMFIFDTETIGGKNRTGIWNPIAITEFAMQEYDFGTQQTTKTNIVLGLADNADTQRVYDEIIGYMEAENWAAIEQNEELFVTAKRAGLYADAQMTLNDKGYYEITSLGSGKDDWKSVSKFKKGWQNLRDAYDNTSITDNGLRQSDQAIFDAVYRMQTHLNDGNAIALGQNFQIFDEPVVNMQLKKTFNYYQEIIDDVDGKLARTRNISKDQARKAVQYMQDQMNAMGGGLKLHNDRTFDTLPLFQFVRDYFGVNTLYNNDKDAIKAAAGGLAKQEYVGAAWFKDLFASAQAHMADFDVTVLNYAATQKLEQTGGKTLIEYLMTAAGKNKKGIYGIEDKDMPMKVGQTYYSRSGTGSFDYAGKGLLNFTHNEKTGEIFTSSGYKFINGQNLGYEPSKINMGTDLKSGQFFTLESVKKVKAADIHAQLGDVMPDMAGNDFIVAQFRMALPKGASSNGLEHITYNYLFNSEKQFGGFMSSNMGLAIDIDENGNRYIVDGMRDLFDEIQVDPTTGEAIRYSEYLAMQGNALADEDMIEATLKNSLEEFQTEKAYNAVFSEDGYRNVQKMVEAKKFLEGDELKSYVGDENLNLTGLKQGEIADLIDGKKIRSLSDDQAQYVSKNLKKLLGFHSKALGETVFYSNTQRNMINAWEAFSSQDKFFSTVLSNLNEEAQKRNWNNRQKTIAFNDLVETLRVQAAEILSTGDEALDKHNITNTKLKKITAYQMKNTYDVQLPLNFSIDNASHVRTVESYSSSASRDIIRLDLSDGKDSSYSFVNRLRKEMFGSKELPGAVDEYNRRALSKYVLEVMNKDENFAKTKAYRSIVKDITGKNEHDYNVNEVSRKILDAMKDVKTKNPGAAILKEINVHTLDFNKAMSGLMNSKEFLDDFVGYNIKNNLINPIDTRDLLANGEEGLRDFVNSKLMKNYMPNREEFINTLEKIGITDDQMLFKKTLYDELYNDISTQLTDILSIGSRIDDMDMAIGSDGTLTMLRRGESVTLKGIPKIEMENGHLYGVLGNQELNVHLDIGYDSRGKATIKTNLGDKFEQSKYVSNRIKDKIQKGEFRMEDFFGYVNKLGADFREEASYAGTSGELWANYYMGTKELNKVLPQIFADQGTIDSEFMNSLAIPNDVKAILRERFNQVLERKPTPEELEELDPALRQMIGPYRVNIMRALAEWNGQSDLVKSIIGSANVSTKDKSKLGKDILMGANLRFLTGFTNPIDENSRPVIGGSGNVRYLLDKNIEEAAENTFGVLYKGSLFESGDTLYINRLYKEGVGAMSTTFTGRTAYVGEIGIRAILENNKDKVLRENKVMINQVDQTEKVYDFLSSFINTFEQAKVASAEQFDQITGGTLAADKKRLSLSKDIIGAMDLTSTEKDEMYDTIWNLKGKLVRNNDGTISYVSSTGKLVKHGDALMTYASYGGAENSWINKLHKGVFKYEISDKQGNVLTDEGINELLLKHKAMFDGLDFDIDKESDIHSVFEQILTKEKLKGQYVVEDVNKTTLPKILINDAEKSMNQLGYMRIGTVDANVRKVLEQYGGEAKGFIGVNIPTPDALRAAMDDKEKANRVLKDNGFDSMEAFIEAVKEESYAADRMLFGKHGLFKGFFAIGNDNLIGHKNKGSIMTGAINDAIAMLGKYEMGPNADGVFEETTESMKLGFKRFVEIVNAGTIEDGDAYKFFKDSKGNGLNLYLGPDGIGLRLEGDRGLNLGLDDADVVDAKRLEDLFIKIDDIIKGKGAIDEDRLVHNLVKVDKETGKFIKDEDGNYVFEEKKTLGRAIFTEAEDGTKLAHGSSGAGGMKLVIDSETQSGMSAEYVDVKQQIRDLQVNKRKLIESVQGRELNEFELEAMAGINLKLEGLEARARDLKETGHLFKLGDRERSIFAQYLINDELYEKVDEGLSESVVLKNEALRGLDREIYGNDYKVFGFLEDELRGQLFYNPYEEDLLTADMLEKNRYSHLKDVYKDIVETKGKRLGVDTAEKIHGVRMIDLANQYNNNQGVSLGRLIKSGFEKDYMSPEEYGKYFASVGANIDENVAMRNVIIDLGEEFDKMPEWQGMNRYIAVPGMGNSIEDIDIKKDWHKMASLISETYQNEYLTLNGQETEKKAEVVKRLRGQVEKLNKSVTTYVEKNGIVAEMAKAEIYAAMDRTKIMSLPDENNPLLEKAMVHGDSIANWQKQGLYYDAMFDSYETFDKRGFFKESTLKEFGMKNKQEMIEYLQTHGAVMIDDRYPNIRKTSLTTARHYLMSDDQMHSTNASYMTKETLLKMLGDSDGDSRSGFMLQQGTVSHALYERRRLQAIEEADKMSFADDFEREDWIKQKVIDSGIDEDTYKAFRGIDAHQLIEAKTTNVTYHERALKTNVSDLLRTRRVQMILSNGENMIAELSGGQSILGKEKTLALNYDPSFHDVDANLKETNELFTIVKNNMENIRKINGDLADELQGMIPTSGNILDYAGNEIDVLDKALFAVEELGNAEAYENILGKENILSGGTVKSMQKAIQQRVRINAYHAESLSKLGISAVGNVNHAFFGASQAAKNYYGVSGTSNYNKLKSEILSSMSYEIEQSSISSKKITLKAGDTKVATLSDILNNIKRYGLGTGDDNNKYYDQAMEWMRQNVDQKIAVGQYQNLIDKQTPLEWGTGKKLNFDIADPKQHAAIADYMYEYTIKTYAEVYSNDYMKKMANAYSSIGTRKANPLAMEKVRGMMDNSFLGDIAYAISGEEPAMDGGPKTRGTTKVGESMEEGYRRAQQLGQTSTDAATKLVRSGMNKIKNWATSGPSTGAGKLMSVGIGLAAGLIAAGYASGNPLNDANPEQVVQQQTKPNMSFGPEAPQMAPNNTGGYIINIKGDTRKGNRQLKKALKQATNASVGGAVNINMSLKTSREAGYTDRDIENILSNYF